MGDFATIYALSCGEKLSPKVHLWRKNDKYEVWPLRGQLTGPGGRQLRALATFPLFSHIIFKYVGFSSSKKKAQKPGNNKLVFAFCLFFLQKMDCKPQNPPPPGSLVGSRSSSSEDKRVPRSAPPSPAPSNRACLLSS